MLSVNVDEKYAEANKPRPADTHVIVVNNATTGSYPTKTRIDDVREYFYLSIFSAICCCLFAGLPAIYMSRKTNQKKRVGDLEGAQKASMITAILNGVAFILGVLIVLGAVASSAAKKQS